MAVIEEETPALSTALSQSTEQENHEIKRRNPNPKMSHLHISSYPLRNQSPTSNLLSLRTTTTLILPLMSILGFSLTWYLSRQNGLLSQIRSVLTQQPFPYFPGTNEPLIIRYTGIRFMDRYLAILVAFFAPAVSGSFPDLSGFGRAGFGGFAAVWTVMVMESLRAGNRGKMVSYITIFGIFIQVISLTCTLPIYLFLHMLTSPISHPKPSAYAATALYISPIDLHILPFTIGLSFLLPTFLMSLSFQQQDTPETSSITPAMHQYFIALWQIFPILTLIVHYSLRKAYVFIKWRISGQVPITEVKHDPSKSPSKTTATTKSTAPNGADYLRAVRPVYNMIIGLLILTHLPTLLSTILPPTILPIFYLAPRTASFTEVFIPTNPFPHLFPSDPTKIADSIAQQGLTTYPKHILTFLQYDIYISILSLLIWSYYLHKTSLSEKFLLDPNSLPSYSPSITSPSFTQEGFFSRNTNSTYRDLLSGANAGFGGTVKAYGMRSKISKVMGMMRWVGWFVVGGPMTVVVLMIWERDEVVRRKVKQGN